jgi:hypothetical protein
MSALSSPRKNRAVLAPLYIRQLIDRDYIQQVNCSNLLTINAIAVRLQLKYSASITSNMVLKAIKLEPAYEIMYLYNTACCKNIKEIK